MVKININQIVILFDDRFQILRVTNIVEEKWAEKILFSKMDLKMDEIDNRIEVLFNDRFQILRLTKMGEIDDRINILFDDCFQMLRLGRSALHSSQRTYTTLSGLSPRTCLNISTVWLWVGQGKCCDTGESQGMLDPLGECNSPGMRSTCRLLVLWSLDNVISVGLRHTYCEYVKGAIFLWNFL